MFANKELIETIFALVFFLGLWVPCCVKVCTHVEVQAVRVLVNVKTPVYSTGDDCLPRAIIFTTSLNDHVYIPPQTCDLNQIAVLQQ